MFYGCINKVFGNRAISVIGPLIMGPIGGPINEVSLYMIIFIYIYQLYILKISANETTIRIEMWPQYKEAISLLPLTEKGT